MGSSRSLNDPRGQSNGFYTYGRRSAPLWGHGIAERVVLFGLDFARRENLRVVALCSYVARVLQGIRNTGDW